MYLMWLHALRALCALFYVPSNLRVYENLRLRLALFDKSLVDLKEYKEI